MMPSEPMAQCSNAPPAKVLYIPSRPPSPPLVAKKFVRASPFKPGMRMTASRRQTAKSPSVNKILDLSSGILKQLPSVLAIERNIRQRQLSLGRGSGFAGDDFHRAALGLDFCLGRRTDRAGNDRKFFGQFAGAENFHAVRPAIGQPNGTQGRFINARTIFKLVQVADIHGDTHNRETGIVETALGDAADERHLAAFKTDTNGTAGTCGLAFATATGSFTVPAGFALTEPFAAVFCAGTGFKIVQSHKN